MGENSAISWTDATVNFWWGCTKVGPGCDHCYAETWSKRTGPNIWGAGVPRRKIKSAVSLFHRLDNGYADWAADYCCSSGNAKAFGLAPPTWGIRRRIFVQSMSDLFDLEVPVDWFGEAWECITACDRVTVIIVTKRVSVVEKRLAEISGKWPKHAGLVVTVTSQAESDRDVPRLLALKKSLGIPWVGLSIEPMLGPIDLRPWLSDDDGCEACDSDGPRCDCPRAKAVWEDGLYDEAQPETCWTRRVTLDWIIVGGESGHHFRDMPEEWALDIMRQCEAAGTSFHFKQHAGRKPKELGRLLDGREHNGMPPSPGSAMETGQ